MLTLQQRVFLLKISILLPLLSYIFTQSLEFHKQNSFCKLIAKYICPIFKKNITLHSLKNTEIYAINKGSETGYI